jgi:hypothetical protein
MTRIEAERNIALAEALESGKYKQGLSGDLRRTNDAYCCLGVACDLYSPDGWQPHSFAYSHNGHTGWPAPEVASYFAWAERNPQLKLGSEDNSASFWNDIAQASFTEIAKGFRALAALEYEGEPA